jgi:HK97 family phage prohead protease
MKNRKAFSRVEIKDADKGEVTAVFSTLNVIDSDDDVTLPGAFENGAKVRVSAYGHKSWEGALPIGKGSIREVKNEAVADLRFFLDTQAGADTFQVVKELGEDGLQEWSYGYDPVEFSFGEHEGQQVRFLKKLKVHEVSPVLLGAGVGTRLLTAKSGLHFVEHVEAVVADFEALVARAADVKALRSEKGKTISDTSAAVLARLSAAAKQLDEMLAAPPADSSLEDGQREYLRYLRDSLSLTTQGA